VHNNNTMLKSTISIVAFTLTFGFSVVLVGLLFGFPQLSFDYSQSAQTKNIDQSAYDIWRLISQDELNGTMRDSSVIKMDLSTQDKVAIATYAKQVDRYLIKSTSLDDSRLPSDFRAAWQEHMKAWENYSEFLNKRNESKAAVSNEEFNNLEQKYDEEISRTWFETLRIARSYGAIR
jgi:hypothetical protein